MDAATTPMPTANGSFDEYIDKLIEEKKFDDLDPEVHDQVKHDLEERLNETIVARLLAQLSDDDIAEFEKFVDANPSPEDIQKFIQTKVPDGTSFLTDVLMDFRNRYLGVS